MDKIKEKLSDIEHQRWADWQRYLHSKCRVLHDGSLNISSELVEHWERQIETPYAELTEKEKDSDREQVARYLPIITTLIQEEKDKSYLQAQKDSAENTKHQKEMLDISLEEEKKKAYLEGEVEGATVMANIINEYGADYPMNGDDIDRLREQYLKELS